MILTRKLFGYLHRVFDVEAHEVPAIRLTCAGGMTWSVADGVFTATLPGPVEVEADLSLYTQGGFVLWLAQQPGIDIDWSDLSLAPLSALALIDAAGTGTAVTLSALTAPQFAYMDAVALELHRARRQIEAMLLQTTIPTADAPWLDEWGGYFGVPRLATEPDPDYRSRIVAEVLRPLVNNTAIEAALSAAMDQPVTVQDVSEVSGVTILHDGSRLHDGTWVHGDVNPIHRYGLFDAIIGYDLLGGWSPGEYSQIVRDIANRMRAAGTFLRALQLSGSGIGDSGYGPTCDELDMTEIRASVHDGTWTHNGTRTHSGGQGVRTVYGCDGSVSEYLQAATVPAGDPYWDNVVLLMHFDGIHGSTTYIDERGHSIGSNGYGSLSSTYSKYGATSLRMTGGVGYLSSTHNDFILGTNDFTVEAWVYLVTAGQDIRLLDYNGDPVVAEIKASTIKMSNYFSGAAAAVGVAVPLAEWVHLAYTRESGTWKAYMNGQYQGADATTPNITANSIRICYTNQSTMDVFFDELRITKGVARYTTNFTPPTAPFPNHG